MAKQKYLFIGGCADGQWLDADYEIIRITSVNQFPMFSEPDEIPSETYRRCDLSLSGADGSGATHVYVIVGIDFAVLIGRVASGYFPKDELAKAAILAEQREQTSP